MRRIFRWLALVMLFALSGCSPTNSNWRIELSQGTSRLVPGVKVYSGSDFTVFKIVVDGSTYLVNNAGGIEEGR
jgi:hypothetical protein